LHRFLVFFFQLDFLLADGFKALLDIFKTSLGVTVAHHVDFIVCYLLLQIFFLHFIRLERAFKFLTAILQLRHYDFRVLDLRFDVLVSLLETFDDVKVFSGDIVIVLFHLFKGFLVIEHEVVDVLVLALLNLVDLDLHAEGKLLLKQGQF
jgi:hypothetical protein